MQKVETQRVTPFALAVLFVAALVALLVSTISHASAASLNKSFVRVDRMKISTPTTGTVCATPGTVASTEGKVVVTFPAGFTVSTTAGNWTVNTTNLAWPTFSGYTTSAWPGIGTATTAVGQVVTFPSSDLSSATTIYCFNWTNSAALSNPSSPSASLSGTIATQTGASGAIDSSSFATAIINDDQIAVSAAVPQTFSFSLSNNGDNLGTLATGSVSASPTPRFATVSTNAKNGWNVWASDATPTGLTSASAGYTIASTAGNTTLSAGTEGYNTGVTSSNGTGSGSITVAPTFVGGLLGKGGGLSTALQTLATSNGANSGATVTLTNNAAISNTTPSATDYADTITVVGAGLF
jgi:hypothetical protein